MSFLSLRVQREASAQTIPLENLPLKLGMFFDRFPNLAASPIFSSIVKKGEEIEEEEMVTALSMVFLHPKYTAPMTYYFSAVIRLVLDKVVSLLQLVGDLRSNPDHSDDESLLDHFVNSGVGIIDYYVRHGRGLELHECACLAFSRALHLNMSLLGSVLNYFKFAPAPHERLVNEMNSGIYREVASVYLPGVQVTYRFLCISREVFSELWDWSCFYDSMRKLSECSKQQRDLSEKHRDAIWVGEQILSCVLIWNDRATEEVTERFGLGKEEAFSSLLRWQEFCQDVEIEKAGLYIEFPTHTGLGSLKRCTDFYHPSNLEYLANCPQSSQLDNLEPLRKIRRLDDRGDRSFSEPFAINSRAKKSYEMASLAVSQKRPVLLYGPSGSGKTHLIRKLAEDSGSHVIFIHMDDQLDGKTLVGTYVCADQPGEFKWQPGSLTQAVMNGFWVVLEDIDKAPSDVPLVLSPLLGGSSSFVTSHGGKIQIADNFRLFSTISTSEGSISNIREGGSALSPLWRRILVRPPDTESLQSLLARYPSLEPVSKKFIETFENVNSALCLQFTSSRTENPTSFRSPNRFSLRDLIKWCERINGLSSYDNNMIYQEAADIFSASYMSSQNRMTVSRIIASIWNVPVSEVQYKPTIQDFSGILKIGRVSLERGETASHDRSRFVETRISMHLLEKIARSVECNEPVLLVGETGTGKTTLVQNLASWLGQKLTVLNLSQQSDIVDLLGGFKPINAKLMCTSLYNEFNKLARLSRMKDDSGIMKWLQKRFRARNWETFLSGLKKTIDYHTGDNNEKKRFGSCRKRKKQDGIKDWVALSGKVEKIRQQICSGGMVFTFVEGAFITALREGHWILLDEVNLAPREILGRLAGVLEGARGSLCLAERGDVKGIMRHLNFRIFACMNPATDAGKRELPFSFRNRFTEYVVDDELCDDDLGIFVRRFLAGRGSDSKLVSNIVCFYKEAKRLSEENLQDGANQKPQYSLRSLYRALEYARKAESIAGFEKALFDGFSMFFLSLLDASSAKIMNHMIIKHILRKHSSPVSSFCPSTYLGELCHESSSDEFVKNYVMTKTVKKHLDHLMHAIFIKKYPVLLQGPTSSGKTSLVRYLAALSGHTFVRINNHEHTDIQEYLGSYMTDSSGKLIFHEGALVKAVRNGHWIVLDELNLAPSDVLEALNRLLDDNRELFVPELGEAISAHPHFMLFATQNPPTLYGGRKMLSRAFRNRFVEIHVDEIPEDELSIILKERCHIAETHALKMVEVMKDLQLHRQNSKAFAGKHGYITPRDLFRWADRFRIFGKGNEDIAREGYYLLAERLRDDAEKQVVQEVLERHLRVALAEDVLYKRDMFGLDKSLRLRDIMQSRAVTWTKNMWRLFFLIRRCYELREPVLLVGETGGGKTTICQLLSHALGLRLHILNCHQFTETSDFLGGFFPVRDRSKLAAEYENLVKKLKLSKALTQLDQEIDISADINDAELSIKALDAVLEKYRNDLTMDTGIRQPDFDAFVKMKNDLVVLYQKWRAVFVWQDGPLVQAMRAGDLLLVDEISLADDSVLERLNSVLEPERKLSLAEKGGPELEEVAAHESFLVLATMNPGGDYGKKELSPALRNRFTEIWVPPISDIDELTSIALSSLSEPKDPKIVGPIVNFWEWFNRLQIGRMLTVRDLLSWISFVNVTRENLGPVYAISHGAFLVVLDGLSLGTGFSKRDGEELREKCFLFLSEQLKVFASDTLPSELSKLEQYGWGDCETVYQGNKSVLRGDMFGIDPFYIRKGDENTETGGFEFLAPTTRKNALRVLRAMQLSKPILLEGSPGVGKTSLIMAVGKYSGHKVVRINLSEQTDMMDLLGSDLPAESDKEMKFAWSDGILLQALKQGSWVLLDELNLAPQSVLEGLNAILDHRAQVFIPELGRTFECPPTFRVFACQNPSSQGGGRKGLPKSFLNRFAKVYVDELVEDDYFFICSSLYPSIPRPLLSKLITFNRRLHDDTMLSRKFGQNGSPWEFNLRDVIRSCQVVQGAVNDIEIDNFLNVVYVQRMRTANDRKEVLSIYEGIFDRKPSINSYPRVQLNSSYLIVGSASIKRNFTQSNISSEQLKILPEIRQNLEAVAHCVRNQWLCILVGPSSSGKTSLIRILAQLTGYALNELNLSSATDISDLLGCFEQYNAFRTFRLIVARVEHLLNEYSSWLLESSSETFLSERNNLVSSWLSFLSTLNSCLLEGSPSFLKDSYSLSDSLSKLMEIIALLKQAVDEGALHASCSKKNLDQIVKTILKLQTYEKKPTTRFEWVTGMLIKAIENGEWIILENANLCNPTVLDRINSLVEPCGSITINECGIIDGEPLTVTPHPNFRLFLTVNPNFGEVSRAMRNRGVEIFMMEPDWQLDDEVVDSEELLVRGVERFLALSGIPGYKLVASMAKAHVYAWCKGQCFNARITYLELEQWVNLFQQLLMNGNQPLRSLRLSWEHIYLSSLGEDDGKEVVDDARDAYLSEIELSDFISSMGQGLCLPGGWPKPLNLRDFTRYSREVTVRQNCMYLEFLGAQHASHESDITCNRRFIDREFAAGELRTIYTIDSSRLRKLMFPKAASGSTCVENAPKTKLDSVLKMLLYAANWAIEQATEMDIQLYLRWFTWFDSKLQPYCPFFQFFVSMLKEELEHPIWCHILRCRQDLMSLCQMDCDASPNPMLSLKLIDVAASYGQPNESSKCLFDCLNSTGVLRLSYQQWFAERNYNHTDVSLSFVTFLKSLQRLEKKLLNMLVGSHDFSVLIQLYTQLIEKHALFWSALVSSQNENLVYSFRSVIKAVKNLLGSFPEEVQVVLDESKNMNKIYLHGHTEKSLLWAHGGHPSMPGSAELYNKQQELLKLCDTVWRVRLESDYRGNDYFTRVMAFCCPEICSLALQGLCMSSYITDKDDEDNMAAVQLDEIYQMLLRRLKFERERLDAGNDSLEKSSAACCVLLPEILATGSGYGSWLQTNLLACSESFYLDVELLNVLQNLLLVHSTMPSGLQQDLENISRLLECALSYSLSSSRPPQTLVAHQKILWTIDAHSSTVGVDTKIAGSVLEMWYWWHSVLWNHNQFPLMNISEIDGYCIPLPSMLIQPAKTVTVSQMLQSVYAIKDYHVQSTKFRFASRTLWKSSQPKQEMPAFLLSIARSLFQQVICTHKKSFEPGKFAAISSTLQAVENNPDKLDRQLLISLIESTSHQRLKSLTHSFVDTLIQHLYLDCSSNDFYFNLGLTWLNLGGLRFHLLHSFDAIDPATKITCKLSELEEKISSLELNMKVREECEYLAGSLYPGESYKRIKQTLEGLVTEHKRLQRKIVFRPDPKKYKELSRELNEFARFVNPVHLVDNIKKRVWNQVIGQVCTWQDTAASFIDRLSNEYSEYMDITQPVQVAVYEMKLGLALIVSGAFLENILNKVGIEKVDSVMGAIYALMRFPRGCSSAPFINHKSSPFLHLSHGADSRAISLGLDVSLLQKLISVSNSEDAGKVSQLQLKVVLYKDLHFRISQFVANAKIMDKDSFELLHKIYLELASIWMEMKFQAESKADSISQLYKFRVRDFKIESVMEVDISGLSKHLANDSFSEWQEFLADGDSNYTTQTDQEEENLEDEWNLMQEHLDDIFSSHNELFGSLNLCGKPERFCMTDNRRLGSFKDSYELGISVIKGLRGLFTSSVDARLVPEHLLRLCLEYKRNFTSPHQFASKFNFYKDSNPLELGKMVQLLTGLQMRICSLLQEQEDHTGLHKLSDVLQMLLDIPSSTPLAKALSGLQFLLCRVRMLQEEGCKFSISGLLEPVTALASSWQKMEFECWPTLLDEVQDQYEINSGKLWLPLFTVLFQKDSGSISENETEFITQSLVEFIETSNICEFRKRLQLLFGFLVHLSMGCSLGIYSSDFHKRNLEICYNLFGFYIQFLPVVMNQIESNRRNVETELNELLKLCKWEKLESYLSIETIKKAITNQMVKLLLKNFEDMLRQTVMLVKQEFPQQGVQLLPQLCPELMNGASNTSTEVLAIALGARQMNKGDSLSWYSVWRNKLNEAVGVSRDQLQLETRSLMAEDVASVISQLLEHQSSYSIYQDDWKNVWSTIARVGGRIIGCADLWRDDDRRVGKKRALSELLKLLEISGLQKHKFENVEISNHLKGMLAQPSYDPQHLLSTDSETSTHHPREVEDQNQKTSDSDWRGANQFYFKSLASVQLLLEIGRKHTDITYEQFNRSISFLNHLVEIQREQRKAAYCFDELLKRYRQHISSFEKILKDSFDSKSRDSSVLSFPRNQHAIFNCMLQQKQLFDKLIAILYDESALLRTVRSAHLNSCQDVKASSSGVLDFTESLIPIVEKSKASLDRCLGCDGAITAPSDCPDQKLVTNQMVKLLLKNFDTLKELEEQYSSFHREGMGKSCVRDVLLSHFDPVFEEGKLLAKQLNCILEVEEQSTGIEFKEQTAFDGVLASTFGSIKCVLRKLCSYKDKSGSQEQGNITAWNCVVKKAENDLDLDNLCCLLSQTLSSIEKVVNSSGSLPASVGEHLKHLHVFLDLILYFGDCFLKDFLGMSKTVSMITLELASVLADLFTKGFGVSTKDEDSSVDKSQAAAGTGMGEGVGGKDVSDQIEDEDQLIGTSEKGDEKQDAPDEVLGNDKGIEMSNEFDGKEHSISEDSGEDKEDGESEDEQLDSAMGEAGSDAEVADEKLWDKDEDVEPENKSEKYEFGPTVVDKDTSSRELRAKEDDAVTTDEPEEFNTSGIHEEGNAENDDQDNLGDTENLEDNCQSKEEAFADPTELNPEVGNEQTDDAMEVDEKEEDAKEDADHNEETCPEDQNEPEEVENGHEIPETADESMEAGGEDVPGSPQKDCCGDDLEQNAGMEPTEEKEDVIEHKNPNSGGDNMPDVESGSQTLLGDHSSGAGSTAPQENWSNNNATDNLAASLDLPSGTNLEGNLMVSNTLNGETLTDNALKMELPQNQTYSSQQTKLNPYRHVGDALKEWKERIRVSTDLNGERQEGEGEIEDSGSGEYGYTSQFDEGTSQALGPAMSEQVNTHIRDMEPEGERVEGHQNEVVKMDIDAVNPPNQPAAVHSNSVMRNNNNPEQIQAPDTDMKNQEDFPVNDVNDGHGGMDSMVSIDRSFVGEDVYNPLRALVTDQDTGKVHDTEEDPDAKSNAMIRWSRCELLTAKSSQELAEQLRLILEPTLASKLHGDYRTGKRINMKKVIPYIASQYRKDKIWLRRTKPSKREYQVVIAVDDSQSMSENGCGEFAIRALMTVCRAMSQLEMGSLAVASFGKEGNMRTLHDFGQSFSREAGIKMISGLTFKQENLIKDEPVVNLLSHLNEMLDSSATKTRFSSGSNLLQQLVLIIGDGKFHEKEKLKRSVRNFLSKKRMVVFLLLDNAEESVIDLKECVVQKDGSIKFFRYLDSFPFPYYIVLRDIEALPTTLADLLRQWFELMQNSRD
ncbi:PREDICTED: midasin-like [Tarenaya hassleriana]|uniref:midasin-like n=1 Tax=Tarenaya hassleriana TaxID=28532 RepID=UPI00053C09EC|nr:PREDICTED: midasin-like [Tarenaya hassleriana]